MTVKLVSKLGAAGIKLWLDEQGQLRFKAPKGVLTQDLRDELVASKANVISFLEETQTASEDVISPIDRNGQRLNLSFSQQRLWFLDRLDPGNASYHVPVALRIEGPLNLITLSRALEELVKRHESLRTTFLFKDGEVSQVIKPPYEWQLAEDYDLSGLDDKAREQRILDIAEEEALRSFDLTEGTDTPYRRTRLFRARIARLAKPAAQQQEYILFICMHHIISDGWSMAILVRELSAFYDAYSNNKPSGLPPIAVQYADFSQWQRDWMVNKVKDKQLAYWRDKLINTPILELPTDFTRPSVFSYKGTNLNFSLQNKLAEGLKKLALKQNKTLFSVTLTVFKILLYRYSGQSDICVGTPVANRTRPQIEPLIGCFINTLALRSDLDNNPRYCDLLDNVSDTTLSAFAHQDLPFEYIVDELETGRDMSYTPVFQTMYSLQSNAFDYQLKLQGLNIERLILPSHTAKYDIQLQLFEEGDSLLGEIEYNSDLFEKETIIRFVEHFKNLLQEIVNDPQQTIDELCLLSDGEYKRLVSTWNNTQLDYPSNTPIHQLIEQQVLSTPDDIAVIFYEQQLSYRELNSRANQLAHLIQSCDVEPNTLIGVCLNRSLEMLVSLLAVLKSGCAYVPIDPDYPQSRIQYVIESAQLKMMITTQDLVENLPRKGLQLLCLDSEQTKIESQSSNNLECQDGRAQQLAYTIYTSGSTGKPKGVAIPQQAFVNFLYAMKKCVNINPEDSLLAVTSLSFDIAGLELFLPLIMGAKVVISSRTDAMDGQALNKLIKNKKITILQATPATWHLLVNSNWQAPQPMKGLCGGEPLPPGLANQLINRGIDVFNMYGPTETTVWSSVYHLTDKIEGNNVPIGYPIGNTSMFVLDNRLQPVPTGVTGELWIGGDGLAIGYLGREDLTQERFISNPFKTDDPTSSDRIYRTGDFARYLSDGKLECLGRTDNQIKIRGFRIELGEIEVALNKHPDVREAVVDAIPSSDGNTVLVGYLVPYTEAPSNTDLKAWIKESLPDYMVPNAYIVMDAMPLTPNGKVDRKALPTPDTDAYTHAKYLAPRTLSEQRLAEIWAETLDIDITEVGINDNFFEVGGHSLLATRLISRIREIFSVALPLRTLFDSPTIEALTSHLNEAENSDDTSANPIAPADRSQSIPMSFAQERLWILAQMAPENTAYNIPGAMRIRGNLQIDALEKSLQIIIQRHETLRTRFDNDSKGQGIQIIQNDTNFKLAVVDIEGPLDVSQRRAGSKNRLRQEATHQFDLTNESLFRAQLLRFGEHDHLLLFNMHHIISDAWSINLLQKELLCLYEAHINNQPAQLPELPIQYADYAAWQHNCLQGDALQQHLDYWVRKLKGAPPLLRLPTDRPRPSTQTVNGDIHEFSITQKLLDKTQVFSQQHGTTVYTSLLAVFALLLSRYSGQDDVCIGTPVASRDRSEIENLIGYFVNAVVIRNDLSGNPSVSEWIERVKDSTLGAFAHQEVPIEQIFDALDLERNLSYPPVAQVGFSFINAELSNITNTLGEATVQLIELDQVVAKYDLTLIVMETEQGLKATAEFNTDLFNASTIKTMMSHYQYLLETIVETSTIETSDQPIDTISMLDEAQLYKAVNASVEQYEKVLPLTPVQRDLYLNAQLRPQTLSNNIAYSINLPFKLDLELWRQANQLLADQQGILRTDILHTELPYGDVAYQCIARHREVSMDIIDLSHQNLDEEAINVTINEIVYRPFQFRENSLLNYHLLKIKEDHYIGIMTANHCITDGISQVIHYQHVVSIYEALAAGRTASEAVIETGANQDAWPEHVTSCRTKMDTLLEQEFWRNQLNSCEALDFPAPFPQTQAQNQTGSKIQQITKSKELEGERWKQVKKYCRKQRITPTIYFKCLYGLAVRLYCRAESDFFVTEFSSGRNRESLADLGCHFQQNPFVFSNAAISSDKSITDLYQFAKNNQRKSRTKQSISMMAQRQLAPQQRLAFMFNYYHFYPQAETLCGHPISGREYPPLVEDAVQFVVKETADAIKLDLYYQDSCFNDNQLLERLIALSEQILAGTDKLSELIYVNEDELHQQVLDWNETKVDRPNAKSVQSLIEAQVNSTPNNTAVICGENKLSYIELNERANKLANYLHTLGVGADTRVGVCLNRSTDLIVAIIAVIKAGGAYVPMDASYPPDRLAYILEDANAPILLTQQAIAENLPEHAGRTLCIDARDTDYFTEINQQSASNPHDNTDTRDLLYIIYTSGSTGQPKGAGVMHQGELNLLNWYTHEFEFNQFSRNLIISSIGFDLTQKNFLAPLVSGGAVVLSDMELYDSDAITETIRQQEITIMNCAPSAFYQLVEDTKNLSALNSLQQLIFGGEPIRIEKLLPWLQSPDCNTLVVNNYGPTECTDIAAFYKVEQPEQFAKTAIPVGRPNDNVQLYLLNDDNQLLPTGLIGELCIAGEGVGRGYLNHDKLNLEKFTPNPFGSGQIYRTGDLMRYHRDGNLEFIGRKDFQVKLNGLRIELGEIEYSLRQIEQVNDSLVTVIDDRLIAYVTADDPKIDSTSWPGQLRNYLPAYMVPNLFVILKQWPLTPNGKIDRKALPSPDHTEQCTVKYIAPRSDTEQILTDIICNVLGLDRVGIHDDFFAIGGNSLAASRAIVQIRTTFEIEIPLNVLFDMTTIEKLASYVDVSRWAVDSSENSSQESDASRDEGFL